jgi:hypothetical protein
MYNPLPAVINAVSRLTPILPLPAVGLLIEVLRRGPPSPSPGVDLCQRL